MTMGYLIPEIEKPNKEIEDQIKARWDSIAKPLDGLGLLEAAVARIGAIERTVDPETDPAIVITFCGDHGITAAGVSQTDSSVTRRVAELLGRRESSVGHMARIAGCDTMAVDVGMYGEESISGVLDRKIRQGTRDFRFEPAMTEEETQQALLVGICLAEEKKKEGYRLLIPGEMGIGNTTPATALLAAYTGLPVDEITGTGAGLAKEGLERKKNAIRQGIERVFTGKRFSESTEEKKKSGAMKNAAHLPDYGEFEASALHILANLGGYELAAMAGLCIGGALQHLPVLLDGYLSCVAGLTAERLCPGVKDYLLASHSSREPGTTAVMKELGLTPLVYADCRLGEGTGALLVLPMLRMALEVYRKMIRFEGTKIEAYRRYESTGPSDS